MHALSISLSLSFFHLSYILYYLSHSLTLLFFSHSVSLTLCQSCSISRSSGPQVRCCKMSKTWPTALRRRIAGAEAEATLVKLSLSLSLSSTISSLEVLLNKTRVSGNIRYNDDEKKAHEKLKKVKAPVLALGGNAREKNLRTFRRTFCALYSLCFFDRSRGINVLHLGVFRNFM